MNQQPPRTAAQETVTHVTANYRPRAVDLYHWLKIREFVVKAVVDSKPHDGDEARRRLTLLAQLVDWVVYEAGFEMTRRTVFDLDIMSEFLDRQTDWTPKVKKMFRGKLKTMGRALNSEWPDDLPEETSYTSAWHPTPYTDQEVRTIRNWAKGQRTALNRNKAQVFLALTLGAGLYTHEIVLLRVRDIQIDEEGVLLHVRGRSAREVPVLAEHEAILIELVQNVDPDDYAFAPGRTNRSSSVVQAFIQGTNRDEGIHPNPRRLRATWLVRHLSNGVPVAALCRAAGLTNLRAYEKWLRTLPEMDDAEFRHLVRRSSRVPGTWGAEN
ncbi:tyrosine-type recombinase/integrase [Micropruina sp.]|uniref:tyrosine-type recombinase/integrase n=1 Tax=Micropruina sp. TaxID=2737536 RepID=UPI0039E635AF